MKKFLFPLCILLVCSSCSNYYQAITAPEPTKPASYNDFLDSSKYYILRNGSEAFGMKDISISSDRKNIQCTLEALPYGHTLHAGMRPNGKMKYKTKSYSEDDESGVLKEVHIYTVPVLKPEIGSYVVALNDIQKAEIIEKDKIKTKRSHALGLGLGIGGAVILIGAIGVAIAASSLTFF